MAKVKVVKDGPYKVSGSLPLKKEIIRADAEGYSEKWEDGGKYPQEKEHCLCRCGQTKNQPFCDGTHSKVGFDGTETASNIPFEEQAEETVGPDLILKDAEDFCALARFCDRLAGTWQLTEESDDPVAKEAAIEEACNCPSGRLVACDKLGEEIEPTFEPSLSIMEDPSSGVSGPIWLKGGIPVESADGVEYERRNRVTLCRCGKSQNKPFCDGNHIPAKFNDGDKSLRRE